LHLELFQLSKADFYYVGELPARRMDSKIDKNHLQFKALQFLACLDAAPPIKPRAIKASSIPTSIPQPDSPYNTHHLLHPHLRFLTCTRKSASNSLTVSPHNHGPYNTPNTQPHYPFNHPLLFYSHGQATSIRILENHSPFRRMASLPEDHETAINILNTHPHSSFRYHISLL
jgi:hypothetical protein